MKKTIKIKDNIKVALVQSEEILIKDVQSALDLMAGIGYEDNCHCIAVNKSALVEDFFNLSTKIAGEILQKFKNYNTKLAIVGDFSNYDSKALKDFIYECNNGTDFFFVSDWDEAVEKLTGKN